MKTSAGKSDPAALLEIVGIGANVHDTLVTVPHYPTEDTKLRADNVVE